MNLRISAASGQTNCFILESPSRKSGQRKVQKSSLRATQKFTIITSNLTFERWDEVFGDVAITSAIVDRLTYKAILVDIVGASYRFREPLRANGYLPCRDQMT